MELVRIHFGIEAVEGLQYNRQVAGTQIDGAPWGHSLPCVDGHLNVFEMLLAKALNGFALYRVSNVSTRAMLEPPYFNQIP